ncbi:MAG: xanthine dehydrogenase family protein [Acidobacteria bacterium]|nr:xanthine dehydrogenase family protein [Acidobacteriota bacterium]
MPSNFSYPPMEQRRLIGKRISRVDGIEKAAGKAKYNSDVRPSGTLHAALLHCPHAHAKIRAIDVGAAKAMPGVTAIELMAAVGDEINWAMAEVAAVAATSEEVAREALTRIKVDYEVLPHLVREDKLEKVGNRAKPAGEVVSGDPDAAFKQADVVHEAEYGIPVITHCCLEPHGSVAAMNGDKVEFWPSTQNVSAVGDDLAKSLGVPATKVHTHMDFIGGGFGSKFQADKWGVAAAKLSKASGGKPVKLYLDRNPELTIAGVRPSLFGKVKIAAQKDGAITSWDSITWMTGGFVGGGINADLLPYVFRNIPNRRINHTAVATNAGTSRAWRAPNHPQLCYLTQSAMDDLAAKLGMDPLDFFGKNLGATARAAVYESQLRQAADMIGWKQNWKPRGASQGPVKRGLGLALGTWGGLGHNSECRATINPDGSVVIELGSQDIGTGTRTAILQVVAETLGLQMKDITLKIGDSSLPKSGASGGSTTIGGVSASSRLSAVAALDKLFEVAAQSLGVAPDQLEAVDGRIQVKGNSSKNLTWKAACAKLGVNTISETQRFESRNPRGMSTAGVGGVQMADVSVDIETGVVKMNKMVGVQDCGLIVNPKLADGQMHGGMIMSICAAIMEERVMDEATGRVLNGDMEFYKLALAGDIGELESKMDITPDHDKRGVIGLGEPSAVPGVTAIANAVANAIGVRVPVLPLTPRNVLNALAKRRLA